MSKSITKKEETAISTIQAAPRGFDDFSNDDMIIPRLRLLQALSGAVTDGVGTVGQFQDSLTEEILPESFEIVFINFKHGAVKFETGKGMVCKSTDGITNIKGQKCSECPYDSYHRDWPEDGKMPACSSTIDFMMVTRDTLQGKEQRPMLISFMKSSYKLAKKIISMSRMSGKDLFAYSFTIKSVKQKSPKGVYAGYDIKRVGLLPSEEFTQAESWFNLLSQSNVKVAEEELVEEI